MISQKGLEMLINPNDLFAAIVKRDPWIQYVTLIIVRQPDGSAWWAHCGGSKVGKGRNGTEAYNDLCRQYDILPVDDGFYEYRKE